MNDINTLKELGLQEVSNKTHIEIECLEWMINKDFDKLNRVNTLGFVKILSREYQLNLVGWVREFEAYWDEFRKEDDNKKEIYFANKNNADATESKKNYSTLFLLILAICLCFIFWYFNIFQYLKFDKFLKEENKIAQYSTSAVVEKAEEKLNELKNTEKKEELIKENEANLNTLIVNSNLSQDGNNNIEESKIELIQEPKIELKGRIKDEINIEPKIEPEVVIQEIIEEKPEDEINIEQKNENEVKNEEIIENDETPMGTWFTSNGILTSKNQIWVGIVYLDNFKKKSMLSDKPITIDLTREQIIITGHGHFVLGGENENDKKFASDNRLRFHVKNGAIKEITSNEFLSLNKGKKAW